MPASCGGLHLNSICRSGKRCNEAALREALPRLKAATAVFCRSLDPERQGCPTARTLKVLILDEADLMFSYGYEDDACYPDCLQNARLARALKAHQGQGSLCFDAAEVSGSATQSKTTGRRFEDALALAWQGHVGLCDPLRGGRAAKGRRGYGVRRPTLQ